ncbi:Peroxiredoxin [Rhodovastum atsumiense]|uniref:thioredoxin-dependent peroxiredoxin n=1 Tax=Rhodovastum atsumiense TaxID=504468 RepID=A0A5M6IVZ2_9PROT|nr:peroxiredoxin [Rhodovastum atsumiense]KAA5612452.1 peroxiredoxin [Rhodovastum atsumiense]CAH2600362.1 Peroxiredoxin [Rhodovastum atsumiense]
MRRIVCWLGLAMLTAAGMARAELPAGQVAPDFTAPAAIGGDEFSFTLSEALKQGPVVLYFYPAAFTRGCTAEAHEFAEALDRYKALGASVVGVSGDSIATLKKFSVSECQSKFPLVADTDLRIMTAYDSVLFRLTGHASRTSYVITPDDRVLYAYTAMSPEDHVANTYKALAAWRAQHPAE